MSKLIAIIERIQNVDNLNIVSFDFNGIPLKMMRLPSDPVILTVPNVLTTTPPHSKHFMIHTSGVMGPSILQNQAHIP